MPIPKAFHNPAIKRDIIFFLIFLTLFLVLNRDFFFSSRTIYERDSTLIEIPSRKLAVKLLREGNLALWTDAYGNGQPFLANPKNAVLYPSMWLYLALPFFTAFKFHYLLHALLGWLGLYFLCRSHLLSRKASILGASLFIFSGMYLSSFEFYNHIAAISWMPWILLIINRQSPARFYRLALLSVFWTLQILAGAPEFVFMTLLLAIADSLFLHENRKSRLSLTVASLFLACLLSAVQLLPSIELLARTERSAQSTRWPLDLIQLINIPFPNVLGNDRSVGHNDYWGAHLMDRGYPLYYSLYMGFGAVLLFLFALRKPWDKRRYSWAASFFLFFLISCGRYSPFFFLYRITPFLSSVRYPVKFFLGSVFSFSILAAVGFEEITGSRKPGRKFVIGLCGVSILLLGLFEIFRRPALGLINSFFIIELESSLRELGRSIETGLFILALFSMGFLVARLKGVSRLWEWAFMALVVLDPVFHNRDINPTIDTSLFNRPKLIDDLGTPKTIYRVEDSYSIFQQPAADKRRRPEYFRQSLYPFTALGDGIRYVFNRDSYRTYPTAYLKLMESINKLPAEGQIKILRFLGCEYSIASHALFSEQGVALKIQGIPLVMEAVAGGKTKPFIVFKTIPASDMNSNLRVFGAGYFDPWGQAIVDRENTLPDDQPENDAAASISALKECQGCGRYRINLARRGIAVFPGNYASGWRAWIDGRETKVFEASLFSKGISLPERNHEIVLRYLPKSFLWGRRLSLFSLASLIVGFIVQVVRFRRRGA